jgi:hypothetical protein
MKQQTQAQEKKQEQKEEPPREINLEEYKQAPAFSDQFLSMMVDYAYNTLHDYLKMQDIKPEALQMLANMMTLQTVQQMYRKEPMVLYVWNDEACFAIGSISQAVPKLGGQFISPSGYLTE